MYSKIHGCEVGNANEASCGGKVRGRTATNAKD